ncbi:ATP synthase F0 subunit B [Candidatus Kaiserbacteria bacterium RIFCSPHIGHO2_02_FULL_50_9]|uniref:ATP synthase subunit b n=1 Tax=Candidatus Kaiserbacteria bacterium RIFCSPLOWO2_01_FULL_51_21 TaxID=1798508 RepID=A0A1F6EDM4_9BACT|nr:MAG: ATP synthase F0 subunit B [Candidatus Kaiserbacteria bacterium RIFCSPHIGHO2_01_FULL_51_33]OGG63601.1 MAG: ATP synthase F0 subunit B [Candidatus Kaiserbacteria bacterium RIFCSPHIGHO2_02_FULL_50_9]OGG71754.1 MAG: ATP synthase F0 subunit B [Candidatus Kaiserbacteria bacterium RIFCSPLOWO2_01_FULL_51_21]
MEQIIGVFGIDWRLLAFQIVNFVILLLLLKRFLYKPVFKLIDERRGNIAEGVRNAEAAKIQLGEAQSDAAEKRNRAIREADALVEEGKRHGAKQREEIVAEAEKEHRALTAAAEHEASLLKKKALEESHEEIARLAVLAAEKIIRKSA